MRFESVEEVSISLDGIKKSVRMYQETNQKDLRNCIGTHEKRETDEEIYEKVKKLRVNCMMRVICLRYARNMTEICLG